jgi:5-methyltetrahydrofolate--homocysteine methyltransferase
VGADFEAGRAYLPGLLMSAEAASAAFDVLKEKMPKSESDDSQKIIIATVKGDIHDIGKNIVKVLLESYGFTVIDLGRDVPPEMILGEAKKHNIKLVGLSALMTTTVPAMEESVKLIHESLPDCRVMVGGAVLTETYAEKMGADFYAKDAMGAVKIAKKIFE